MTSSLLSALDAHILVYECERAAAEKHCDSSRFFVLRDTITALKAKRCAIAQATYETQKEAE